MAQMIVPTWQDLQNLVEAAEADLTICSPYFSQLGVGHLFDHFSGEPALNFWTRLSPSDWAFGIDDPQALLAILDLLLEADRNVALGVNQRLHAKAYLADSHLALIGSANLTGGGFASNLELMVLFRENEANLAAHFIREQVGQHLVPIDINRFRYWVEEFGPQLSQIIVDNDEIITQLGAAQRGLDDLLGYGENDAIDPHRITHFEMEQFVDWLRSNQNLPGAEILLQRHDNTDGNNLTGHFKQSFYSTSIFLQLTPRFIEPLCSWLAQPESEEIYQPDEEILESWMDHIDEYATLSTEIYNYSVLRGILPPNLGGTRLGGGGASSTLKRMLPLVARFLDNQ